MNRLLTIVVTALISTLCHAHRDAVIKVGADGQLEGLPPQYNPAFLRIEFSKADSGAPPIHGIELKIGSSGVRVPECVTGLILTRSIKDIRVNASWYHDTSILPPYLSIELYDPGHEDAYYRPGYSLLFNLSNVRLIEMHVNILRDGGRGGQSVPVDIAARCPPTVLQSISELRVRPGHDR